MPAFDALFCSEIWAYTLAKKKYGTNTTDISSNTMLSTEKPRSPKIRSSSSGSRARSS